jgi:hypothetical protein
MLQADRAFVQAVDGADRAALSRLLDEGFTWTDLHGKTRTKAEVLSNIPNGPVLGQDNAELKSYVYGSLADVQAGRGRVHEMRVWVKRHGQWKIVVFQDVLLLDVIPVLTPGAGAECENPCKNIPFHPKSAAEREVAAAYSRLETAAMAHNSAIFGTLVADEFVAASSNSNKLYDKQGRMQDFDRARMGGVAPTPLVSARMVDLGSVVLMKSEHQPDRGKALHVTRVWVKRYGNWLETLSFQTALEAP